MDGFDTQRLRMKPLTAGDEELYRRIYTDPALMRHVGAPLSVAAAQRSFRGACAQGRDIGSQSRWWVIVEQSSAAEIGLMALLHGAHEQAAEIGVMLLGERQGQGMAIEAIAGLVGAVFANPGLRRLWMRHPADHARMATVARKLGFRRETPAGGEGEVRWSLLHGEHNPRSAPCTALQ